MNREAPIVDALFLTWLQQECGYKNVRPLPSGRWAGTQQFLFTHAILVGQMHNEQWHDDRWCYKDEKSALAALDAWTKTGGVGEPENWHRHPGTGRRRPDGNQEREYVNT